jgi:acetolactate synthase-1/2/3 large subunit
MTVAQFIATELHRRGVRFVFGIPGGPSIPYMDEFKKVGIEFILTSSETAAGVMADVTGRLTGVPGICHATYGPGATNLATGVGGALLDRSPMIALTTEVPFKMRQRTMQMNIDHQMLFEPVTKATSLLDRKNAGDIINDAFDLALSEQPGPVHIGLPDDISARQVSSGGANYETEEWDQETNFDSETATLLEYSKKPLLVAGLTAARNNCGAEIEQFLKDNPMPVIITPMAKGLISEDNPCYAGVFFHALSDRLKPLIEECDLVISLGYDPVEYNYEQWLPDVPLIHISTTVSDMPAGLMIKQIKGSLAGIPEIISTMLPETLEWDMSLVREVRNEITRPLRKRYSSFSPVTLLKSLRNFLPPEAILTLDVGSHIHLFGQLWRTPATGKLLMTNGWSSMGFSIPAAIAAKLNYPDLPVVSITGDGGFLMVAGEIMTARRYGINIIIIVLTDGEMNLIKLKQQKRNIDSYGVDLYDGDLFGADTFLGVPVIRVADNQSFTKALKKASGIEGPVIIDAAIDKSGYKETIVVK